MTKKTIIKVSTLLLTTLVLIFFTFNFMYASRYKKPRFTTLTTRVKPTGRLTPISSTQNNQLTPNNQITPKPTNSTQNNSQSENNSKLTYKYIDIPKDTGIITKQFIKDNIKTANIYETPIWGHKFSPSTLNSINVKECGAKGDGSTNDIKAIFSALLKAINTNDKKVYFPEGNYIISDEILLDYKFSGIKIYGSGKNSVIILA